MRLWCGRKNRGNWGFSSSPTISHPTRAHRNSTTSPCLVSLPSKIFLIFTHYNFFRCWTVPTHDVLIGRRVTIRSNINQPLFVLPLLLLLLLLLRTGGVWFHHCWPVVVLEYIRFLPAFRSWGGLFFPVSCCCGFLESC